MQSHVTTYTLHRLGIHARLPNEILRRAFRDHNIRGAGHVQYSSTLREQNTYTSFVFQTVLRLSTRTVAPGENVVALPILFARPRCYSTYRYEFGVLASRRGTCPLSVQGGAGVVCCQCVYVIFIFADEHGHGHGQGHGSYIGPILRPLEGEVSLVVASAIQMHSC